MAKRRNLKKEKAERNKAYARKFRKKTSRRFFSGRRFNNGKDKKPEEESANQTDES